MNWLNQIEGVLNSDLGRTFTNQLFPAPKAPNTVATVVNPVQPKKDYTPWIIGGVSLVMIGFIGLFIFNKK